MDSAYSSITLWPRWRKASSSGIAALPATMAPVRKREVGDRLAGERAVAAADAARNSLSRMASQALTTAVVVLAVVFEPPATGPAGKHAVAEIDGHLLRAQAQALGRRLADHGIGAVADLMRRNRDANADPSGVRRTRAAAGEIWVG